MQPSVKFLNKGTEAIAKLIAFGKLLKNAW